MPSPGSQHAPSGTPGSVDAQADDTARSLEAASAMEAAGRPIDAIDLLMDCNRRLGSPVLERRLVRLRHEVCVRSDRLPPLDPNPPVARNVVVDDGVPTVVEPGALSPDVLRDGILRHGSLHVRGLVEAPRVRELVDAIDRAIAAADEFESGRDREATTPWFEPFPAPSRAENVKLGNRRKWVHQAGGVWGADSPRLLYELFDTFETVGLRTLISNYLGERPALAVDKCTFRRVARDSGTDWHQDGAFLGPGIRTVNVWLALTDCGQDAPGLDVVPARLDRILPTGTDGAIFSWSVGPAVVEQVATTAPVQRPRFAAGDVLFFDDLFLHRTATDPAMTRDRYAIETWCFAPSAYPEQYVPLAV
jgi:hypothetical protein